MIYKASIRDDLFYFFVELSWRQMLFRFLAWGTITNVCFALLYVQDFCSFTVGPLGFIEALAFSAQTYATVGYGHIAPTSTITNLISMTEIVVGVLSTSVMTGLVFAKFSLPKSYIKFSKNLLLTRYDGKDCLIFRMLSDRNAQVINLKVSCIMIVPTETEEGISVGKISDIKLEKPLIPMFVYSFISSHIIDFDSPIYSMTKEDLKEKQVSFYVVLEGVDKKTGHPVVESKEFEVEDLIEGHIFEDVIEASSDGGIRLNKENIDKLKVL